MDTREKILKVASSEFSQNGYRGTTIRQICRKASINVALINYHFGGKKRLYKEVVDYLVKKDPTFGKKQNTEYRNDKDWENGLFKYIYQLLFKITDSSNYKSCLHKIIFREIMDPSELFSEFYNEYFITRVNDLKTILSFKLDSSQNKEISDMLIFTIISQCLFYEQNKSLVSQYYSNNKFIDANVKIEAIAKIITLQVIETIKHKKVKE